MTGSPHLVHPAEVRLRDVGADDLGTLFEFQLDPESNRLAALNPRTGEDFYALWKTILDGSSTIARAILADEQLVGSISCFKADDETAVGYWVARRHWGRGIATRALELMLEQVTIRPLVAHVATHNAPSLRVLHKCGFKTTGSHLDAGNDRYVACEVVTLRLE